MDPDRPRIPVLYLAPWVSVGGSDTGTIDWFRWIDRERFAPSLITTQPSPNLRLDEIAAYAEEVWALPELMTGAGFPSFILGFIASRGIQLVHIMNSRLAFDLLPDIRCLPGSPATVVQLHVEEPDRSGYVRYVTTRYGTLVDAFSVTSHHLANAVREYGIPGSRCRVIATGVDAETTFNPDRIDPMPLPDDGAVEILYCGRLVDQKDPLLMVQVAAALRDRGAAFRVHCVGDGHLEPEVRAAIAVHGLEDHVLLHGASDATARWYRAADLVLMTSTYEGVPYVVYEAMAMAVPIVAPALPGNVELMAGTGGFLVEDRTDVAGYVDAVCTLIGDRGARRRIGAEGRQRIRSAFSLAAMGQAHGDLYDELLRSRPAVATTGAPPPPLPEPLRLERGSATDAPLVSVIVPCYGHGRYLEECLASIRAQTYSPIETVVVDDGSRDPETVAALRRLDGDPGVTLLRLPVNSGPSAARNAGVTASAGRFILPVDADNLLVPTAVELLVGQLQRAGEDIGFVYPNRDRFGTETGYVHAPGYNLHTLLGVNFCDTCSLIDRAVFDGGVRYAENMTLGHEDWDLVLQLAARGIHGEPAEGPTVRVRRSDFTRSGLVDRAQVDPAAIMRARHPALYAREEQIKSRWSPGLSFVALDPVPSTNAAAGELVAGIARQTLRDAEVILPQPGDGEELSGPVIRRRTAARSRAEATRDGLAAARGRVVCLHEGSGEALSRDPALLEKLLRIAESSGEAVALADTRRPGVPQLQQLAAGPAEVTPHTVLWARLRSTRLPEVALSPSHPVSDVVRILAGDLTIRWHNLALPGSTDPDAGHHDAVVMLGHPGHTPAEEVEQWARLNRPPRLREHYREDLWRPARTRTLLRCFHPQTGGRTISVAARPPEGFVSEYELGALHESPPAGSIPLVMTGSGSYRTPTDEGDPGPGETLLGYLEGSPLPLLDMVELATLPSGEHVLIAGSDDPLRDRATPLLRLGWIEPLPLRPRALHLGPERQLIVELERTAAELQMLRSGAAGRGPRALGGRVVRGLPPEVRRRLLVIPGVRRAAAALRSR